MKIDSQLKPWMMVDQDVASNGRYAIGDLHLNVERSELYATDGHAMGIYKVEVEEGDRSGPIPIEAVKHAAKVQKTEAKFNGGMLQIEAGDKVIVRSAGGAAEFVRDFERQYPDVPSFMLADKRPGELTIGLDVEILERLVGSMGLKGKRQQIAISFTLDDKDTVDGPFRIEPTNEMVKGRVVQALLMSVRVEPHKHRGEPEPAEAPAAEATVEPVEEREVVEV